MDNALFLLLLLFFIELAETNQYQGRNFDEAIHNLHAIYRSKRWQFVLYHSSLAYMLYISAAYDLINLWTLSIMLTKMADIMTKLYLFKKIESGEFEGLKEYGLGELPLNWKLKYFSVVLYTGLFIPALF